MSSPCFCVAFYLFDLKFVIFFYIFRAIPFHLCSHFISKEKNETKKIIFFLPFHKLYKGKNEKA